MVRFWTSHWRNQFWRNETNAEYELLEHTSGNSFRRRGVIAGDVIYVVSLADGRLLLGGKMVVKQIASREEAIRIFGPTIYEAGEHIIGERKSGTPLNLHRELDPEVSRQLRFVSPRSDPKGLFFVSDKHLDAQATRGVRELTPESAALLDRIIAITDAMPRSDRHIIITEQLLHRERREKGEADIPQAHPLPEEVSDLPLIREGAKYQVTVNAYERDPIARQRCIEAHGTDCCVCGLSFGAKYGKVVDGFIHVHHLRPLSDVGDSHVVDPVMDLCPVCPNCHVVLHRREPPYSPDEVRRFLETQKEKESECGTELTS